ncbi:MAG: BamA/TamA family outer membrane protein [Flavobacteriales bacterium]|nr:BamA/TamA family outer membrane protein [Flavobacteriales bacterium]
MSKTKILFLLSMGIILCSGCNVLKFVPEDKSLLDGNRVKVEGGVKIDELKEQILHVPNRKMLLLVKFNLWAYFIGNKVFTKDSTKVKMFFTETVGEKPVYIDSFLVKKSEKNLKSFLFQKGYFNSEVSSKIKTVFKRSYVTYYVKPGKPFLISSVAFNGSDRILDKLANEHAEESYLKINDKIDYDVFESERDRLTTLFRNSGFYYFNKAFIRIIGDTIRNTNSVNINVNISNIGLERDAKPQTVQKVIVEMDFPQNFGRRDTIKFKGIHYLFKGYNIKPNIINRSVIIRPKELFAQSNLEATYNRLIGLGLFDVVNIRIQQYPSDTVNKIMVLIYLKPSAKHVFIWEPQVITTDKYNLSNNTNNPRNYGFANSFILNNKNVFRNAEDFNITFRLAAETQLTGGTPVTVLGVNTSIFGNYESKLTFELLYPKLLGLIRIDTNRRFQLNKTSINLTLLTEINTNYQRQSLPINLTYQTLRQTRDKSMYYFFWTPIQLSYNSASIRPEFLARIENPEDSLRLVRTFRSYIIPSHKFAIVFHNKLKSPNNYWSVRYNVFEFSGNLFELYKRSVSGSKDKEKTVWDIPYFQFFRSDIDAVHYNILGKNKTLVFRANFGLGKPYGNSYIMPFERQFFVGGSNSLRGWRPRVLGPGGSLNNGTSQIDRTGDVMLVTNAEYRFAVAPGLLDGAFFADAGNIWQITSSATPSTKFEFNHFYKQLALNSGIGLRFVRSFIVIRLDWGVPLHDPSEPAGSRWVIGRVDEKSWIVKRTVLNLAVGYPF